MRQIGPKTQKLRHFLTHNGGEWGVCGVCVARVSAHARHTNDTCLLKNHVLFFFFFFLTKCITSSVRHLLVTDRHAPPIWIPAFKSAQKACNVTHTITIALHVILGITLVFIVRDYVGQQGSCYISILELYVLGLHSG